MSDKNKKDEIEAGQDVTIEDLPVEESKQDEVKGGPTSSGWLPA